jgi:hypothetical protein
MVFPRLPVSLVYALKEILSTGSSSTRRLADRDCRAFMGRILDVSFNPLHGMSRFFAVSTPFPLVLGNIQDTTLRTAQNRIGPFHRSFQTAAEFRLLHRIR